ncbi:MAG: prepilin-type N-terminal cleavage/methylation domain-containing protein [Candidatus Omnitrophota bacterium]|jgi:type II secretion system protein G|nr:MAG: prepilin-type N-terminal cleavage/methylation domain-containing protein [Candidatus Omnitrophota bacterium]
MTRLEQNGFTLIELLIVVAIIGILAAIAVPNFINAQIRAKVARVKSDIRALSQAHEMYRLDNNTYPPESEDDIFTGRRSRSEAGLFFLTAPVSYISSLPHDPFQDTSIARFEGTEAAYETGVATRAKKNVAYNIFSRGPDMAENGLYSAQPFFGIQRNNGQGNTYAPSNGLVSNGDIYWYGGDSSVVLNLMVDGRIYNGNFPPNFGG